jgi:very-short-patch-repair endonuclease
LYTGESLMARSSSSTLDQKIEHWRENLLDMTLRNRLLNFKPRSAVQIVRPGAGAAFDLLIREERTLTMREMTEEESALPPEQIDIKAGEILPAFDPKGLTDNLRKMRLKARSHLQEQGVNILYMTFGLVRWYESTTSRDEMLSPLVLVPVELVKEGPLQPFRVRVIDEDVVVNPNLQFKLGTEYRISLPEWPDDPEPLSDYVAKARDALSAMKRWKVEEQAYLGLFSFAKLSMYKELLDERDKLAAHPFINALAGDQSMLPVAAELPTSETLDSTVRPSDSFQVLDADSSQQEAIEMAKRGISFVLQGPPGTGKSQTIANIIAEALAADRKVLFVSEKMAALEVVKKRLDDKGLGDYILEMHSRKASKVAVMDELRRSMVPLPVEPVSMDELQRLERARDDLDGYVDALHRPRGKMGRSAFQVHGRLAVLAEMPDLAVPVPDAMALGPVDLDERLKLVKRVEIMRPSVERMEQYPWRDLRTNGWKPGDEIAVSSSLQELRSSLARLRERCARLGERSGLGGAGNVLEARKLLDISRRAAGTVFPEASWFETGRPERMISDVSALQELYSRRAYDRRWLSDNYADDVLSLDLRGMSSRFDTQYNSVLRSLNGQYRAELASLQRYRKGVKKLGYAEAAEDLRRLVAADDHSRRTAAVEGSLRAGIGPRFKNEATDWEEVISSLRWTSQFMNDAGLPLTPQMMALLTDRSGAVRELAGLVTEAETELRSVSGSLEWLDKAFAIRDSPGALQSMPFEKIDGFAADHLSEMPSIKEWIDVSTLDRTCRESGLEELIGLGRRKMLPPAQLVGAYEKRFFRAWLDQACSEDSRLGNFRSEEHAQTIALFRRLDEKQLDIAQRRLRNILNTRREQVLRPREPASDELNVLRHEAAKKKRFKQIRQLFQECPNVILALKPCLLMSPLSVSQYLDPSAIGFDLVIFDEASQVRPEDAIGSIMRAKQVIVVGDNKQLPPTSFFRGEAGDEDDEAEDLESILDECSALNIRQQMLLWHYRSRHESLIAFSNNRIYDGKLYTFPSPGREEGEWGVSYVRVPDGVYDRAGTRANAIEAGKVAELVFEHFAATPDRSLGVVAFSEAQQLAVLDRLEEMRKERPEFEKYFAEGEMEEFFVKNLENVQGDERDVMIFSVGYGKDSQGKMYQNFGPLNKAGGERRLNVAVTRAKKHVKLVASIGAEDIEGSSSTGALLLKDYLAYAASGGSREVLQSGQERRYAKEMDSPLEDDVYRALTAKGLKVQRWIGCSGYRIDLAVEDPDRPGSFLLGIECDGASYRSGRTARDRDRTRESVLRGLEWNLHRIWSKDWITDRDGEVRKVMKSLASHGAGMTDEAAQAAREENKTPEAEKKGEKESFRPSLLELVRDQGPVHCDVAKGVMDEHVYRPEDVEHALSQNIYALTRDGTLVVRDNFIWPAGMTVPPVRRPSGKEPMELDFVALEEIGEAELYNMGGNAEISKSMLIARTAAFYRNETLSERAKARLELALDKLIESKRLVPHGKDLLRRAR